LYSSYEQGGNGFPKCASCYGALGMVYYVIKCIVMIEYR
jgi:hypothetical protein